MNTLMCKHKSRRFDTGAKRGLGRVWYDACANRATHDPDVGGAPTVCYAHSHAAAEKKEVRREERHKKVLAELEVMKEKFAARKAKQAVRQKAT